jgi:Right handed beta helix region
MTKIVFQFALLTAMLVCCLPAAPAQATGAPRTFVSAAGSDSNNCTNVATPCRHMAAAYAATAPNDEIYVLDPANYGSLTITGPVSIEGHGWASIAPVSGNPAITINATGATDKINIIGVVLDGTGLANTQGILFNSGGTLTVRDSVIRNFSNSGIFFGPSASTSSQLFVSNTLLSDNGTNGIGITPSGSGITNSVLSHVEVDNNGGPGLFVATTTQTINVAFSDSVSTNNLDGITASSAGTTVKVMVRNSTVTNNAADGLDAQGTGAVILTTRSTVLGNATEWAASTGGSVLSFGDNDIGRGPANNLPTPPLTSHD